MERQGLTRRRAFALGAAAGLGVVLGEGPAAAAVPAAFSRRLTPAAFGSVVRVGRRFDLVGVRGADHATGLELRARRAGGRWSAWTAVGSGAAHAPDGATPGGGSDPVWTGAADELQLRARRVPPGALRLDFVVAGPPHLIPRARAAQAGGGAPPIIPREQWGAVPAKVTPGFGEIDMAFIHHTENANDYTPDQSAAIVLAIQRYHMDHNGWNDIGYNFLVDRYGQVFEGRAGGLDQAVIGAQAQGWNSKSTGIATIGGFMAAAYPEDALGVLARLVAWKLALHGVPASGTVTLTSGGGASNRYKYGEQVVLQRISGHRDGCSTDCPGDVLYGQLDDLRSRAASLQGTIVTRPRLTLTTAATRVGYGKDAVFAGKLLGADGVPVGGARVTVRKQGSSAWVPVASATTASDGSFAAPVAWHRSGVVRAEATVSGVSDPVRSPQLGVAVVPLITTSAPAARSRVKSGGSIAVRGTIRPAGAVSLLVEIQGHDGRWRRVRSVGTTVHGSTFTGAVALRRPGLYRITARSQGVAADAVYVRAVRSAADVGGLGA